jgi:3',5'-cyclic AMP phosphodiesterase CpdA
MKIIQLTDTHLVGPGALLYGLDPAARLRACVDSINDRHADADLCVVTGDLADSGGVAAYEQLRAILSRLRMPYRLLLGNHDSRSNFRQVFPEAETDPDGFVQSVMDTPVGRLLFLDTLETGRADGVLCQARLAWIGEQLERAAGRPVHVFMHHPPEPIGMRHNARMCLFAPDPFLAALREHGGVRHIFAGHVHLPVVGSAQGIPFSCSRGTCHHIVFDADDPEAAFVAFNPSYNLLLLGERDTLVHVFDIADGMHRVGTGYAPAELLD